MKDGNSKGQNRKDYSPVAEVVVQSAVSVAQDRLQHVYHLDVGSVGLVGLMA